MTIQKQDKTPDGPYLERLILNGLSREWDQALDHADTQDRFQMKKPLFSLKELSSRHGYWSGEKAEICLSKTLVMNHSWNSVRDVLKHEMAHQWVDQVMQARNEAPHGPSFLKACEILRADPRASGTYPPLDERIFGEESFDMDKRMTRIKKLMALAGSKNRNEAESAMAKAHELMIKYNLNVIEENQNRFFHSVFLGKPRLRHPREDYRLARLICEFYGVEGIWISAYVLEKGKMGRVLEISGTRTNLQIAAYVHDFVVRYTDSAWLTHAGSEKRSRRRKTDFACGVIEGFRSKMTPRHLLKNPSARTTALIRIEDPLLTQYFRSRYPRTVKICSNITSVDHGSYVAGLDAGKSMVVSKGICRTGKSDRLIGTDFA
jgi:hypothetical protein